MDMIRNPNYAAPAKPAALTAAQRTALRNAVKAYILALPADQEFIGVHDLVVAVRANLPVGVTADQFDGADVRAHLAALGYALV